MKLINFDCVKFLEKLYMCIKKKEEQEIEQFKIIRNASNRDENFD